MKYFFILLCLSVCTCKYVSARSSRIVGGSQVSDITNYPYSAFLMLRNKDGDMYECGGVIISFSWILTAAHCIDGIELAYIRIGSVNSGSGGRQYEADIFRKHPQYFLNSTTVDYDIGLIKIEPGMLLDGRNTSAVRLPSDNQTLANGTMLRSSGWGLTKEDGAGSKILKSVDLPYVSSAVCSRNLDHVITPRMLCAGGRKGESPCSGDSGGPAVTLNDETLFGVVSFGYGCGHENYPEVFASVPYFREWIRQNANV